VAADPTGRFCIAFLDGSLVWEPGWTDLAETYPNLVTSYTIDRGRQYELDHTDVGRAVVQIADRDGILDPTNPDGPYYTGVQPFKQAAVGRYNPVDDTWYVRFRGFVETYDYSFDPSQRVNMLTVSLVDLQALLSTIELVPGAFGIDTSGTDQAGQIGYAIQTMQERVEGVLGDAGIPDEFRVTFSGNVELHATTYSPGETVMDVVQSAVDGEWPGVGNSFVDRRGRICTHGRYARFDPAAVISSISTDPDVRTDTWDYHVWHAGDGAAVAAHPASVAQVRAFAFERGVAKLINSALATPQGIADDDVAGPPTLVSGTLYQAGQHVYDTASIAEYGYRSWSAQNLTTKRGLVDSSTDLEETARFSFYYVQNYAYPQNRITTITFRSLPPGDPRAAHLWALLSQVDIADKVTVTVGSPGGGGFDTAQFYVEGIHEQVNPLNPVYDDITLSLDLSPVEYFTTNPFPVPG
jgi:hypothetical protein